MKYSTVMATMTTRTEIIKPWSIGAKPDFRISLKLVFKPMAAKADTMRNLLTSFMQMETDAGIIPKLFTAVKAKKPNINHGKIRVILNFVFIVCVEV